MKRAARILLRLIIALVALVIAGAIICLDGVDHRPYFREAYYKETTARLQAQIATNTMVRGPLEAGFGRALLTPTLNATQENAIEGKFHSLPLAGYGNREGRPATGTHDDLYVKAIALRVGDRTGVMISADTLIIPPEVTTLAILRLTRELKLSREQVYLSATHTHTSLGGWGEGRLEETFAGGFQPGVRVWFADRIVTATREAMADLKPAAFGHNNFAAPEWVKNRLVGELGKVDPEFSYIALRQEGGKVGILGSFAAHATILPSSTMEFSADYPGYWQRAVEEATGGTAVFLAGGVGSHSPNPGKKSFEGAERMGQTLARTLLEQLPKTSLTNFITFGTLSVGISMPPLNVRIADEVRLRPWLAAKLLPPMGLSFMQAFRLDDAIWISTPCDFSGELALDIKDLLHAKGRVAVITSFNGDYVGYVIRPRYYHMNGYEPRTMSFFGPNVPDYFDELIRTMALNLADK